MPSNVTVKVNRAGVRELLRSPEMLGELEQRAQRISTAAGPGHRIDSAIGPNRARAAVITETVEAMRREATERSLSKALDAGRG